MPRSAPTRFGRERLHRADAIRRRSLAALRARSDILGADSRKAALSVGRDLLRSRGAHRDGGGSCPPLRALRDARRPWRGARRRAKAGPADGARVRRRRHPRLISAAPTRGATAAPVRPEVLPGSRPEVPPWPDRREDATASPGDTLLAPGLSARLGGEQKRIASACGRLQCSASARRTGDNDLPIACRGGIESGPTRATSEVRIQCEGSREMAPVLLRMLSPRRPIHPSRVTTRVSLERRSS